MASSKKSRSNVQVDSDVAEPEFKAGDIVAMTPSTIRTERVGDMIPKQLYKLGHENRFLVLHSFKTEEHGHCVTLFPCCKRYVDRQAQKPQYRCTGHPSVYFEKVDVARAPKKGDKSASVSLPFLPWDVAGLEYKEEEDSPELSLKILGQETSITGPWAKILKTLAEDNKLF